MKDALFSNPSIVEKTFIPSGEEYTDGRKLLIVDNERHSLLLVTLSVVNLIRQTRMVYYRKASISLIITVVGQIIIDLLD